MKSAQTSGENRTGMAIAPKELAQEMLETMQLFQPALAENGQGAAAVRIAYAEQAEPVGSIPPPKGMGKQPDARDRLRPQMAVLVDKLGERLAFERSGVRLYDALLSKFDAYGSWEGGPSRADLEHLRSDELEHFRLLERTIQEQGGDPTAVTPSANLHGVASAGIPQVLADARTNLQQCLEAMLVAELVDNDCWENLITLVEGAGLDDAASEFQSALEQEREHLEKVRGWLKAAMLGKTAGRA
jgi:rubrerythrin